MQNVLLEGFLRHVLHGVNAIIFIKILSLRTLGLFHKLHGANRMAIGPINHVFEEFTYLEFLLTPAKGPRLHWGRKKTCWDMQWLFCILAGASLVEGEHRQLFVIGDYEIMLQLVDLNDVFQLFHSWGVCTWTNTNWTDNSLGEIMR